MTQYETDILSFEKVLYKFAFKLTKNEDDAKDLVQDTFVKALLNKNKFDEKNLKSWLFTIIKNSFIDKFNINKRWDSKKQISFEDLHLTNSKHSVKNDAISNLNIEYIEKIIFSLQEKDQKMFYLYSRGFKYREIAERLNIPVGTVKARLFFIKTKIKQQLNENSKT